MSDNEKAEKRARLATLVAGLSSSLSAQVGADQFDTDFVCFSFARGARESLRGDNLWHNDRDNESRRDTDSLSKSPPGPDTTCPK